MNRTDALKKLMKKQTQAIAARWQYRITGKLTHPTSETEPWTAVPSGDLLPIVRYWSS